MKCALVHHTGTMIRFTTSQLPQLPRSDTDVTVALGRRTVNGRFHLHPANPYIAGPEIVRWIKARIPFGGVEQAWIDYEGRQAFRLTLGTGHTTRYRATMVAMSPAEAWKALRAILDEAEGAPPKQRRQRYARIARDPRLSSLLKRCFGATCQVEACTLLTGIPSRFHARCTEVHHLEAIARGGRSTPYNLVVICANHHRLVHRDPSARVTAVGPNRVEIETQAGLVVIRRNISKLT